MHAVFRIAFVLYDLLLAAIVCIVVGVPVIIYSACVNFIVKYKIRTGTVQQMNQYRVFVWRELQQCRKENDRNGIKHYTDQLELIKKYR